MRSPRQQPGNGRHKATSHPATVAAKPSMTATKPPRVTKPGTTTKQRGLSPEVLEAIGKVLPGIIRAVATLIEALRAH